MYTKVITPAACTFQLIGGCACRSRCTMQDGVRRSKRARHATGDPSFHYSPAVRRPRDIHVPCALQGRTNAKALEQAGNTMVPVHACSQYRKGTLAELPSNEHPAVEPLQGRLPGAALPSLAIYLQDGTTHGQAPASHDDFQKADPPQPSRDTSLDSSSSQVSLPRRDSKPGNIPIQLQQHALPLAGSARGLENKQSITAAVRKSRHKSKPHRSPFE